MTRKLTLVLLIVLVTTIRSLLVSSHHQFSRYQSVIESSYRSDNPDGSVTCRGKGFGSSCKINAECGVS